MKIDLNRPLTDDDHKQADEEHSRVAANQIAYLLGIADALEAGTPLTRLQIDFAAAALRYVADGIPTERHRGRLHKLPGELAVLYSIQVVAHGKGANETIRKFADEYQVSEQAVRKELKNQDYKNVMERMKGIQMTTKPNK